MVRRLSAAGHIVHIWNRSPEKAQALADIAIVHPSPNTAVSNADITISMLSDGATTLAVLEEQSVIDSTPENSLIINMGSVEPECDRHLAQLANSQNKRYLDAPVSGGVKGAEEGTLTILVGGYAKDLESARPVLEAMGRPNLLGPIGAGQTAKLANQLIVAITIGAVSEAFKLAESAGCDIAILQQALQGGFADSRILELHGKRMVDNNFEPGGRCQSQLKDLNNAMNLSRENNLSLPLATSVQASFKNLVEEHDGGELDHSAYYLWLNKKATP